MSARRYLGLSIFYAHLISFLSSGVASAALWQTEAQLTEQYREPVDIRRSLGVRTFTWNSNDLTLEVEFLNGKAQRVLYQHREVTAPFSAEEIDALLRDNCDGKQWRQLDGGQWELGAPPIAEARSLHLEQTDYSQDGVQTQQTHHWFEVASNESAPLPNWFTTSFARIRRFFSGGEKRFRGTLELKQEQEQDILATVAIVRQPNEVLEIPWASSVYPAKAQLRAGATYEVTIREEEPIDMDKTPVFVSDRVHGSHSARVGDSDGWFTLVRIREGASVLYDEAVCEVHHTRMERKTAEVGYGMYAAATKADAICDREFPHHADWIRGGCLVGDVKSAPHYVCNECAAAATRYKQEHPDEARAEYP